MSAGDRDDDLGTGTFVGREHARADLERVMHRAGAGRGAFALVTGEPGIGKTTLVERAVGEHVTLWARATERGELPLGLWAQVARAGSRAGVQLDPGIEGHAGPASSSAGYERFLRFDAVIESLREASRAEPLVVVLDDLQWADRESRSLLELLVGELDRLALVVVGITRSDFAGELPRAALTIELGGLGPDSIRALVGAVAGGTPDDAVVDAAQELTGGNPFFLGEVARHLRAGGAALDAGSWRGVLPRGARSLLARQLAALDPEARRTVAAAAVLGATFSVDALAEVVGAGLDDMLTHLDPVAAAGLVRDGRDGTFTFAHALIREAALAELDLASRRALFVRAAEVVETREGEGSAAIVAAHYGAAGDRTRAAIWWARAGEQASTNSMYAEACECFEAALEATRPDAPLALQCALAESLSRIGAQERARDLFVSVARAARAADDAPLLTRAALGVGTIGGGFEIRVLDVEQIALLEEVLAEARGAPADRARIMARLSVALSLDDDHDRRVALATEAVAIARDAGDDAALVHALAAWCDAHAGATYVETRLTTSDEMLAAAVRRADPELELLTRRYRIVALMESGQFERATAEIRAFARLADSLRQPVFQWYARVVEGMLALLHGDLDAAWELATTAAELGRRARSANAQMLTGGLLATVLRERGDHEGFLRTVTGANSGHPEASRGMDFVFPLFLVGYGVDAETVRGILARLPRELGFLEHDSLYLSVLTTIGTAAAYVDDTERCDDVYTHLLPHADRIVLDGTAAVCFLPVSATLARIARSRGDVDEARTWYERALAALTSAGAPLHQARLERELAELGAVAARVPVVAAVPEDAARFERQGDTWLLTFAGESTHLRDAKGLRDLAVLLARPDGEVHALDLVAASEGHGRSDAAADGDIGPALDAHARGEYEARIRDLTDLIEEAEQANDIGRAARLDDERAQLLRELAAALGLSGRARSQSSDAERARKAVTMRIRDAIGRIDRELPALGGHLRNSVRTGIFCSYRPEQPVEWRL